MSEFVSVMFRAITGFKLTLETLIVLGFFFGLGWLFGKLTRNIGILKGIALAIFGGLALIVMSVLPGAFVFFFVAGVLTNHGPLLARVIYWAQDIADIFYALKHMQAFEEIRAEEARMEEELRRARAEAYAHAHAREDTSEQARWRQEAGAASEQSAAGEKEKSDETQGRQKKAEPCGAGSAGGGGVPGDPLRDQYLKVLGLSPGKEHSPEDIRRAYRKRAKDTHPDVGGDAQEFMDVRAAYLFLRETI